MDEGDALGQPGGGVANLGVVGRSNKAGGCTGIPTPVGDFYAVDYVAHEMGHQFSGTFMVTGATHSYRGSTGYRTSFQISGRSSRTLLELIRPPADRDWSAALVVGVVTNNNDPDQMGRVRVKYPSLSDSEESAWARIATPSAGSA